MLWRGSRVTDASGSRLRAQAETVLARDALGRSQALERLFRFLLACSLEGRAPKELEIADQVFGRALANAEGDASIRVHIHRLRRKLDDFYAGAGAAERERIAIPRGGYRLTVEEMPPPAVAAAEPHESVAVRRRRPYLLIVVASVLLMLGAGWVGWSIGRQPDKVEASLAAARASAVWQPVVSDGRRTAIVAGDYYIFGEQDENGDIARLVRKFDINSARDLEDAVDREPELARTQVDLGLTYLPIGIGNALRVVVPVLLRNDHERVSTLVWPASELSPEMLKLTNIVYLGYLSGLGSLRDPVFSGSRFAIGGSYDEIIDRRTARRYVAGTHLDQTGQNPRQDYAIISSFPGVSGNRIVVIAGTRDAALMQAADYATRPESLAEMTRGIEPGQAFETLLSIESVRNVGLRAHLLVSAPRQGEIDWSGRHAQVFPDDSSGAAGAHAQ